MVDIQQREDAAPPSLALTKDISREEDFMRIIDLGPFGTHNGNETNTLVSFAKTIELKSPIGKLTFLFEFTLFGYFNTEEENDIFEVEWHTAILHRIERTSGNVRLSTPCYVTLDPETLISAFEIDEREILKQLRELSKDKSNQSKEEQQKETDLYDTLYRSHQENLYGGSYNPLSLQLVITGLEIIQQLDKRDEDD